MIWSHCADRCRAIAAVASAEWPYVVRIVVASVASWQLCVWLGARQPPVYAVIVPLVAMRDAPYSAFNVSVARLVGVVAGLCLGVGILSVIHPALPSVALVLALAVALGAVLRIGGGLNIQVAVSALLVFASTDPSSYAASRLWETAVGAAVTIALSPLLRPTNPVPVLMAEVREVAHICGETLRLAAGLGRQPQGGPSAAETRAWQRLRESARAAEAAAAALPSHLATAGRAVRAHPLWRRRYGTVLTGIAASAAGAAEIASLIRRYSDAAADLGELSAERGWDAVPDLVGVLVPLADAVELALAGQPAATPLTVACAALAERADIADSPLDAIVMLPLRRIIGLLVADG